MQFERHTVYISASRVLLCLVALFLVPLAGCGKSGPPMAEVSGKITFTDGTLPQGEQTMVTFTPSKDSTAEIKKGAASEILPDGTYDAFTMKPGDGVFYGKYKVIFGILGDYRSGGATKVAEAYTNTSETPYEVVIDQPTHTFDFEIEKAK